MKRLRYGMIGGGSNFGRMHMRCAAFDHYADLVAGCFSRNTELNQSTAERMNIGADRCYADYKSFADIEAARTDKIDFIIISTPNVFHYEMTKYFLTKGFHVMLDKPMAFTSAESIELAELAQQKGLLLDLTYTFTGFPVVRQMHDMIQRGDIGRIHMVAGEFPQCWIAEAYNDTGDLSSWRTKRDVAGISCCTADIGIHIESLVRYLSGLHIQSVSAVLDHFDYPSELDLNSVVTVRYQGGAVGQYFASQVCAGCYSDLKVRIFGDKGTLEWTLMNADRLTFARFGEVKQDLAASRPYLTKDARALSRTGQGFPEGIYGAVSNIYTAFCKNVLRIQDGEPAVKHYPDAWDGVESMKYIEAVVDSANHQGAWTALK